MEKNLRCPFCGKGHEILDVEFGRLYKCGEGKNYLLHDSVFSGINYTEKERRLNVIYNFIRKNLLLMKNHAGIGNFIMIQMLRIKMTTCL